MREEMREDVREHLNANERRVVVKMSGINLSLQNAKLNEI